MLQICFFIFFHIISSILKALLFTLVLIPTPYSCMVTQGNADTSKGWWYWLSVEGILNFKCDFASPENEEEPVLCGQADPLKQSGNTFPSFNTTFPNITPWCSVPEFVSGLREVSSSMRSSGSHYWMWERQQTPCYQWVFPDSRWVEILIYSITGVGWVNWSHMYSSHASASIWPCSYGEGKRKLNPFHQIHN